MTGMRSILTRCSNIRRLAIHLSPEPALRSLEIGHLSYQPLDQARNYMRFETTFDLTVFGQMLRELAIDFIELDLNTARYRDYSKIQGEIESLRELGSLRCLKFIPRDLGSPASLSGKLPRLLESLVLYCHALSGYNRQHSEDLTKLITADGHLNLRVTME